MESRKEKAVELFMEGYNCSQAVFAAYADLFGIDFDMALKLSASFGAGMGRMREVCGAVSGMFLVAGLMTGTTDGKDVAGKQANYDMVQKLAAEYKKSMARLSAERFWDWPNGREALPIQSRMRERQSIIKKGPALYRLQEPARYWSGNCLQNGAGADGISGRKQTLVHPSGYL